MLNLWVTVLQSDLILKRLLYGWFSFNITFINPAHKPGFTKMNGY